eukprot:scaffold7876_cov67-Phaeocystis_antarctica.AAC.6
MARARWASWSALGVEQRLREARGRQGGAWRCRRLARRPHLSLDGRETQTARRVLKTARRA